MLKLQNVFANKSFLKSSSSLISSSPLIKVASIKVISNSLLINKLFNNRNYSSIHVENLPYTYQPFPHSHPHLFNTNEIVPGFTKDEFLERQSKLLKSMEKNSILIIGSKEESPMYHHVNYPYRQDSNFYYLTGIAEPDCLFVIKKIDEHQEIKILYIREKSNKELFQGPVNGIETVTKYWGDNIQIKPLKYLLRDLKTYLNKDISVLYYDPSYNNSLTEYIVQCTGGPEIFKQSMNNELKKSFTIAYPNTLIEKLRSIKSKAEIEMFKKAAKISAEAFKQLMKKVKPGMTEAHVEAILEFECKLRGAQRLGYPPVVAGGDRANVIHYLMGSQVIKNGDLIRIDGAAEYFGYPNDITRTIPINAKFTELQRKLYTIVLDIQKQCIEYLKKHTTETITIDSYHQYCFMLIEDALGHYFNIGAGSAANPLSVKELVDVIFPHMVGHPQGMEIHEKVPRNNEALKPGMIITCEPGIYFPSNIRAYIPDYLVGLGVQIEDDILITEDGVEVLTKDTPKEIEEIEEIMSTAKNCSINEDVEGIHYVKQNFSC